MGTIGYPTPQTFGVLIDSNQSWMILRVPGMTQETIIYEAQSLDRPLNASMTMDKKKTDHVH